MLVKDQIKEFLESRGLRDPDEHVEELENYDRVMVDGKEVIGLRYEYDININGYHMYPELVKVAYRLRRKDGSYVRDASGKIKLQLKEFVIESYKDDHIKTYWDYVNENGTWKVYRVCKEPYPVRKLCATDVVKDRPDLIEGQIFTGEIKSTGYKDLEEQKRNPNRRYNGFYDHDDKGKIIRSTCTYKWCVKYDKWPMFAILKEHPKMTFNEIKNIIENEGGVIDSMGFIDSNGVSDTIVKY